MVNETVVVEVKSCVCSDYPKEGAPPSDKKDRYVTVVSDEPATQYQRAGIFPIGRPGQKFEGKTVVSERCIKHLRHLSGICLLMTIHSSKIISDFEHCELNIYSEQ